MLSPLWGVGTWLRGASMRERRVICSQTQSYKARSLYLRCPNASYFPLLPADALILHAIKAEFKSLSWAHVGGYQGAALWIFTALLGSAKSWRLLRTVHLWLCWAEAHIFLMSTFFPLILQAGCSLWRPWDKVHSTLRKGAQFRLACRFL